MQSRKRLRRQPRDSEAQEPTSTDEGAGVTSSSSGGLRASTWHRVSLSVLRGRAGVAWPTVSYGLAVLWVVVVLLLYASQFLPNVSGLG